MTKVSHREERSDEAISTPSGENQPRLFSPAAAWLTRRTLSRRDRPDFPERRKWSGAPAHVHWKTGTSYGHRDAWAVGSGARYTAAVWLGNFDNQRRLRPRRRRRRRADPLRPARRHGATAAAARRTPTPAGLEWLEVCAYSGYLPGAACPTRKRVLAVRAAVPTRRCPYHVAVDVDLASGLALQPACRGGHRWETRSFVTWPASLRRWLGERQRWLPEPPPLAPGCEAAPEPGELRILSPPQGQVLVLLPGVPVGRQEVPLQGDVGGGAALSWFVDGEYLGSAPADERLWWQPRRRAATASPSSTPPAAPPSASCRCAKASRGAGAAPAGR